MANRRELSDTEAQELALFGIDAATSILETLLVGQEINIYSTHISNGNAPLEEYLANLISQGIDVGRGNAQYGFRMPVPAKADRSRDLIIFRRK